MAFLVLPLALSSVVGGGYYYYNSTSEIKKLDLNLQNEIKKGLIDDDKSIIKLNINIKAFNLKEKNILPINKYFLWVYIFNFIQSGNFNLKRINNEIEMINLSASRKELKLTPEKTKSIYFIDEKKTLNINYLWDSIFKSIQNKNYKLKKVVNITPKKESEYKKFVNKINQLEHEHKTYYKTTFLITDRSELPDLKQLYLKEKLIKEFPNNFKLFTRVNMINKTLDKLENLLAEYNKLLIEKNNTIKEFTKSLKYPKIHEIEKIKYESKLNLLDPKFDIRHEKNKKKKSNHNINQPPNKFIRLTRDKTSIN